MLERIRSRFPSSRISDTSCKVGLGVPPLQGFPQKTVQKLFIITRMLKTK